MVVPGEKYDSIRRAASKPEWKRCLHAVAIFYLSTAKQFEFSKGRDIVW